MAGYKERMHVQQNPSLWEAIYFNQSMYKHEMQLQQMSTYVTVLNRLLWSTTTELLLTNLVPSVQPGRLFFPQDGRKAAPALLVTLQAPHGHSGRGICRYKT